MKTSETIDLLARMSREVRNLRDAANLVVRKIEAEILEIKVSALSAYDKEMHNENG